jgi:hypothetical protein
MRLVLAVVLVAAAIVAGIAAGGRAPRAGRLPVDSAASVAHAPHHHGPPADVMREAAGTASVRLPDAGGPGAVVDAVAPRPPRTIPQPVHPPLVSRSPALSSSLSFPLRI